eukprot:5665178-Prorocentrum_lima.AAC.1
MVLRDITKVPTALDVSVITSAPPLHALPQEFTVGHDCPWFPNLYTLPGISTCTCILQTRTY